VVVRTAERRNFGGIVTELPPTGVTEFAAARTRKATAAAINQDLRAWAKGIHTTAAAVELLIRGFGGRFAAPGNPWIQPREHIGHWVDLEAIPGTSARCRAANGPTC